MPRIVAGITIPESVEAEVFARFDEFVATLSVSAFKNREPKGNLLTLDERTRFVQMIADNGKIVVTSAMLAWLQGWSQKSLTMTISVLPHRQRLGRVPGVREGD